MMTEEFFREVYAISAPDGVMVVNLFVIDASREAAQHYKEAVAATIGVSWPGVYLVRYGNNYLIYALKQDIGIEKVREKLMHTEGTMLYNLANYAADNMEQSEGGFVFTDDFAPVEQYTHRILAS